MEDILLVDLYVDQIYLPKYINYSYVSYDKLCTLSQIIASTVTRECVYLNSSSSFHYNLKVGSRTR